MCAWICYPSWMCCGVNPPFLCVVCIFADFFIIFLSHLFISYKWFCWFGGSWGVGLGLFECLLHCGCVVVSPQNFLFSALYLTFFDKWCNRKQFFKKSPIDSYGWRTSVQGWFSDFIWQIRKSTFTQQQYTKNRKLFLFDYHIQMTMQSKWSLFTRIQEND